MMVHIEGRTTPCRLVGVKGDGGNIFGIILQILQKFLHLFIIQGFNTSSIPESIISMHLGDLVSAVAPFSEFSARATAPKFG